MLLLLFAVVWTGCTPVPRKSAPPKDTADKPYDFTKEGKIPPAKQDEIVPEADVEEIPVTSDDIDYEEVPPQVDSSFVVVDKTPRQPEMQEGFRVQVFAAGNSVSADEVRQRVQRTFSLPAYVTPVDNLYKVRIGDFTTREEAEKFLARCRAGGYPDAWIVETLVRVVPSGGN